MDVQTLLQKQEKGEDEVRTMKQLSGLHAAPFHQQIDRQNLGSGQASDDDPNEADEVVPIEPGRNGPPKGRFR